MCITSIKIFVCLLLFFKCVSSNSYPIIIMNISYGNNENNTNVPDADIFIKNNSSENDTHCGVGCYTPIIIVCIISIIICLMYIVDKGYCKQLKFWTKK